MPDVIAATEATLCRILAEVLDVDLVRPQDGFFEVGGDSVLAVQVVARAREAGLTLSVRDLFDHQTAETLAAVIGDLPAGASATGASATGASATGASATGASATGARASGATAPAESPLLTFEDDEFGELEDVEADLQASGTDVEWETLT